MNILVINITSQSKKLCDKIQKIHKMFNNNNNNSNNHNNNKQQ